MNNDARPARPVEETPGGRTTPPPAGDPFDRATKAWEPDSASTPPDRPLTLAEVAAGIDDELLGYVEETMHSCLQPKALREALDEFDRQYHRLDGRVPRSALWDYNSAAEEVAWQRQHYGWVQGLAVGALVQWAALTGERVGVRAYDEALTAAASDGYADVYEALRVADAQQEANEAANRAREAGVRPADVGPRCRGPVGAALAAEPVSPQRVADLRAPLDEVRCRRLVVVDDSGAERVVVDVERFTGGDDAARVRVGSRDGERWIELAAIDTFGSDPCPPYVSLYASAEGQGVAHLTADAVTGGALLLEPPFGVDAKGVELGGGGAWGTAGGGDA